MSVTLLTSTLSMLTPGRFGHLPDQLRARGSAQVAMLKPGAGARARYASYDLNNDGLIDEAELQLAAASAARRVSQSSADEPIIMPFTHRGLWLWRRWRGTTLELIWLPMLGALVMAACIALVVPGCPGVVLKLRMLNEAWTFIVSLTTFILTYTPPLFGVLARRTHLALI